MDRQRILKNKMIIPGGQIGEIAKHGKVVEKQYQPVDTDTLEYCWLHNTTLTSDWKHPNPEDKKKLDKIRLKEYEIDDWGVLKKGRYCPKCLQTVYFTRQP